MSRLAFGGAEWQDTLLDGLTTNGTVTINTSTPRSGSGDYEFASGAASNLLYALSATAGRSYFARIWFRFSANPSVDTEIAAWSSGTNYQEVVKLTTAGKIQGTDGSTLTGVLAVDTWHCLEIKLVFTSITSWASEVRVNGTVLNTRGSHNPGSITPNRFSFGNYQGRSHGMTLRVDDWAVNDDQGSAQTSYPGTTEKILLSLPTADSAVGADWKLGDLSNPSGAAHNSVDNVPPVGAADAGAAAGAQIRDAVANIGDPAASADLTCQSYTAAGAPSGATITATQAIAAFALAGAAVARAMGITTVSNPADGTEPSVTNGNAAAAYPTGFARLPGAVQTAPSVTLGTAPVVRVAKRGSTSSTRIVCAVGLYFGYEPAAGTTVVLGQATETDTAQPVTRLKARTLAQATETDAAQAVTRLKSRTLSQATETDSGQAIAARSKTRTLAQAIETDSAQAVARLKSRTLGQASEVDAAQAITGSKVRTLSQAEESDAAQPVTRSKARALGQATEVEAAQALTLTKLRVLGQAVETDTAQPVTATKSRALGQATETDEAFPVTGAKTLLLGQAEEFDLAQAITVIVAAAVLSTDGYTDAVVGILTVAPVTGIFTSPANRN